MQALDLHVSSITNQALDVKGKWIIPFGLEIYFYILPKSGQKQFKLNCSEIHFSLNNQKLKKKGCIEVSDAPFFMCAEHVRQLGGESPLDNLMEVKS